MTGSQLMEPAAEELGASELTEESEGSDNTEGEQARTASLVHLWASGVGAVIGGDFFGWQVVLANGFGSALVGVCLASALYVLLAMSVAEVAALLQKGAGPPLFARTCFGVHAGFLTGLAELLKCLAVIGTTAIGVASYVSAIVELPQGYDPLWWLLFIGLFTSLNALGAELSVRLQAVVTSASVALLVLFYAGAAAKGLDFGRYAAAGTGAGTAWEGASGRGVLGVAPFGLWFFLGIEELPLATEITVDPGKTMPRGLLLSFATLLVLAFLTLFVSSSIPPGTEAMATTTYPLLEGYMYAFGRTATTRMWCLCLVVGLLASLHSFIFATGQLVVQMAHDGYLPHFLARRSRRLATPCAALAAGGVAAYGIVVALYLALGFNADTVGFVAIAMALLCSLLSYGMQLCCFLWLRVRAPTAERPFKSPLGVPGAVAGLVLCAAFFFAVVALPATQADYATGLVLAGLLLACGALAWALLGSAGRQPQADG